MPARVDGFVETQLAVSRDTVSWTRWREPFIGRGEAGAWDYGMVYTDGPIPPQRFSSCSTTWPAT